MANTTQNASKADSQNSSDNSRGAAPSNPIVVNPGSVTTGALQEDTTLSATGSIGITDSNAGATQTWSLKGDAKGTYGSLAVDNTGKWTYTLNNSSSAVQSLAAGQSRTDSFTVQVKDSKGATASQVVTMTVKGTNDAPVITHSSVSSEGQEDDRSGRVSGSLTYTDADKGDSHSASVTLKPLVTSAGVPASVSSSLSQAIKTNINDEGESGKGALKWDFSLPSTFPKIAVGQSVLATYQLSIADKAGATSGTQDVNVLIVGTGGTPKVYAVAAQTSLTELANTTGSASLDTASGTLAGSDLSMDDHSTVSSTLVMSSWSTGTAIPAAAASALGTAVSLSAVATPHTGEHSDEDGDTSLAWQFKAPDKTFDFLAAGETLTLAYRLTSKEDGDSHSEIITVTVTGTNDAPVISSNAAAALGLAKEDTTLSATGQLTASDADHNATQAWTVQGSAAGAYGAIAVNAATGQWTYTLNNGTNGVAGTVQALAAGESHDETFTIRVTDDKGATADQIVKVTVTGTNDAPVISSSSAAAAGTVNEDNVIVASGQLTASDVDNGATQAWNLQSSAAGAYGAIAVDAATGKWTYTLDNSSAAVQALESGESHDEIFTVRVTDDKGASADQTVTVSVTGTNDAPVITSGSFAAASEVTEDTTLTATGQLTASDVDHDATQTWSVQGSDTGAYGTMAVDAVTGEWTYALDNAAHQNLAQGESHVESFTVRVTDDKGGYADQAVTVTVSGTNDAPVVSGVVTGTATEDGAASPLNALSRASDVDNGTTLTVTDIPGSLPAGVSYDASTHSFTLDPSNAAYQSLAAGQPKSVSVNYGVSDGIATTTASVSWTVTGSNDAPVMASADTSGTVTAVPAGPVGAPSPIAFTVEQYLGYQSNDLSALRTYAATHAANYTVQTDVIDYTDDPAGFAGDLPESSRWPAAEAQNTNGTAAPANDHFFARITADFSVSAADTYTFRTFNDDGVFLLIDNNLIISDTGYHPEAPFTGSIALAPGNHSIELFFYENEGEASLEFSARSSTGSYGLVGANGGGLGGAVQVSDSGAISFSDVDLTDAHVVSAAPIGATVGTLTAVKASDTTGSGTGGQVNWAYTADNTKLVSLAQGETKHDLFNVTVDDQHGGTATRQVDVSIVGVNDAPVINSPVQSGAVTEAINNSADEINNVTHQAAGTLAFSDVDLTDAHSVTVAGNGSPGYRGTLSASVSNPSTGDGSGAIAWTFAVADGALDDLAQGQVLTQTYSVAVDDGHGGTASRNVVISITGAADNSPPVAVNDNVTTNEDVSVTFSVVGNDTDVDVQPLSAANVSALSNPVLGTLQDLGGGQFSFNPTANASGTTSFTYQANDGQANSGNTATVNITVKPVNDAPVAVNNTNALTVTTLASQAHSNVVNWVDWTSATGTGNGTPGTVSGTINLGNGQTVGVTYTGEYFFAQTNGGTNVYNLQNGTVPVGTYTSTAVANGPNASSDIIALSQQSQKTLTFTQPVDNLFFAVVSLNGMAGGVNNGYLFDHDFQLVSSGPGYYGQGAATKVALPDGRFELLSTYNNIPQLREFHGVVQIDGTVQSLTWTSLAAETWNGFTIGTYGQSLTATATGNVLANDSDLESDPLTVTAVNGTPIIGNSITLNLNGAEVTVDKNGTYLYDENGKFGSLGAGAAATDSFTYTVSDGHGGLDTATVTINITGVNDAPTAKNDTGSIEEDSQVSIAVLDNDTDPDTGDTLSLQSVGNAVHGAVAINGSNVVYTPAANYNGTDSFTYTMKDAGGLTSTASVNVTVNPVNDAPVATNVSAGSTNWNTQITVPKATLLAGASDADHDTLTIAAVAGAQNGAVVLNTNGDAVFTPNANYFGPASFTYTVKDTANATSNAATASLSVVHQDVAPTITYTPANLVINGSFEQPGAGVITSAPIGGSTAITGWTVTGNSVDYITGLWPAADQSFSLDLDGNGQGGVQQTFTTAPGVQYTVSFAHGVNSSGGGSRVLEVSAPGVANTYTINTVNGGSVSWTPETFTFTAAGPTTTLGFNSLTSGASGPTLDAVSVVSNTVATLMNNTTTIKGLIVSDVDAGSNPVRLDLGVGHGKLALGSAVGLTGVDSDGTDGTLSYTGSQAAINTALASGVTYTPGQNYYGSDALAATVNDQGQSGSGGPQSATKLVPIFVNFVNLAPTISFAGNAANNSLNILENSNVITTDLKIHDVNYWDPVDVTISSAHDSLFINQTSFLQSISGNGTHSITLTTNQRGLDVALGVGGGLQVTPDTGYFGGDAINVVAKDVNSNQTTSQAIAVSVSPPAPTIAFTGSLPIHVSPNANVTTTGLNIHEVNYWNPVQVTLSSAHDKLFINQTSFLDSISGNGSHSITLIANQRGLDVAFGATGGLQVTPDSGYVGSDTLNVVVTDFNAIQLVGTHTASAAISIAIN